MEHRFGGYEFRSVHDSVETSHRNSAPSIGEKGANRECVENENGINMMHPKLLKWKKEESLIASESYI